VKKLYIFSVVAMTLLTLYLFSNFDVWFMYAIHFMEQHIANNEDRILASIPAGMIAFFFSLTLCLLPSIIIGAISNLFIKAQP